MSSRALVITLAALALIALALRVYRLDERPPHTDEAVNAWILGRVMAGEPFAFDPRDRHGPLLPAAGLVVAALAGRRSFAELDERTIRLAPALVGAAATGLFLLAHGLLPNGVLAGSAALWAVSPLPLYYARYAIHETLLVAATLAFLLMLVRAILADALRPRVLWATGAGLAAGTMLAAKLSALIPLAAAAVAVIVAACIGHRDTAGRARPLAEPSSGGVDAARPEASPYQPGPIRAKAIVSITLPLILVAALTITFAYSWGFTRLAGLHDLFFGLDAPLARATGQGHEKGPLYFVEVLGYGPFGIAFLLAAAIGGVLAWRRGGAVGRGLVVYAATVLLAHSAIPYKTPWLALGMFLPLAVLAAWAIDFGLKAGRPPYLKALAWFGLLAFGALTAHADHRLVFAEAAAETNPLAYAHTTPDLRRLDDLVQSLATRDPLIAVSLADPWPLPFLLRRVERVGYWQPDQALPDDADLIITTPDAVASLGERTASWRPHYFSQRPGVMLVALQNPDTEAGARP